MADEESLIQVLEVLLRTKDGDYDRNNIKYSPDYKGNEDDKKQLKNVIEDKVYNNLDTKGEIKVLTSVGEVIIKHQEHPQVPRRKLIQGFIKKDISLSVSFDSNQSFSILSLLEEVTPDPLKNNQEATDYLNAIKKLFKLSDNDNDYLKFCLFNSILEILVANKARYTENENAAKRLSANVENLRSLYPEGS